MKKAYIAGVIVLALAVAGSVQAPLLIGTSKPTWSPVKIARIDQVWTHRTGHVSYGIVESTGAVSEITVVQACGLSIGDNVFYQDNSDGTMRRVVSPASCQEVATGE